MRFPMRCCGCFSGGGAPGRRRIARGPGLVCSGGARPGLRRSRPLCCALVPTQVEGEPDGASCAEGSIRGQADGGDAHEPAEVGDRPDRPHGGAEAWKRATASRFSRARTTAAHAAWTTMRMIARATVTACAGFAEAPRAIVDMTTVPAVSHGRPWFAGAARAIPPTRRRPRRPRAPATRCSCPRRGTRRPGG